MRAADWFSFAVAGRLVAMVAMLLGSAASFAQADESRRLIVSDIVIVGNKRMTTEAIQGLLKSCVGGEYTPATVQDDVRTLMATKRFGRVETRLERVGGDKVVVYFFVLDYPNIVEEVVYEGARSIKKGELETLTGVRKGGPINPTLNRLACKSIVSHLRDKGRIFASCVLKEGDKRSDKRVVFSITEGPEIFIRDIEFGGNHFVGGAVLSDGEEALLRYYRSYGFHSARQIKRDRDVEELVQSFHITEGQRYRLQGVQTSDSGESGPHEELSQRIRTTTYEYSGRLLPGVGVRLIVRVKVSSPGQEETSCLRQASARHLVRIGITLSFAAP